MSDVWKRFNEMQADLPSVHKDAVAQAGSYSYRYVTLGAILGAVQPIIRDNGFVLRGTTTPGLVRYEILDAESDGTGTISYAEVEIPTGTGDMQRLGAAITYARRYALTVLLDIAADDDDGERAAERAAATYAKAVSAYQPDDSPTPLPLTNKQLVYDWAKRDKARAKELWGILEAEYEDPNDLDPATLTEWLSDL